MNTKEKITQSIMQLILLLLILTILFVIINNFCVNQIKIVNLPYSVKCLFDEKNCEEADIDCVTLLHALVYMIIGVLMPDKYLLIIILIIILEFVEPMFGRDSNFVIHPLVNISGYAIGSLLSPSKRKNYKEKYQVLIKD
jgi:hypothetical protein